MNEDEGSRSIPPLFTPLYLDEIGMVVKNAIVDTGAGRSFIGRRTLEMLAQKYSGCKQKELKMYRIKGIPVKGIHGPPAVIGEAVRLKIRLHDRTLSHQFLILNDFPSSFLIGRDFLSRVGPIKVDFSSGKWTHKPTVNLNELNVKNSANANEICMVTLAESVVIPPRMQRFIYGATAYHEGEVQFIPTLAYQEECPLLIAHSLTKVSGGKFPILVTNTTQAPLKLMQGQILGQVETEFVLAVDEEKNFTYSPEEGKKAILDTVEKLRFVNPSLTPKQVTEMRNFLFHWAKQGVFATNEMELTPIKSPVEHVINTGSHQPIHLPPRRMPFAHRPVISDMVKKMMNAGQIEESHGPWAFPVVLAKKKSGEWRFCVDYPRLNDITVRDEYPLPRIDDILDSLHGATVYSSLDLYSAFHQIGISRADAPKTAFSVPGVGHYQFKVLPFGLTNSPATFQKVMDTVLSGLQWSSCLVYLDDILVFGSNFDQHQRRLDGVLARLHKAGLKVKLAKCDFLKNEIAFLGHVVTPHGLKPDPAKVKAITDMPRPADKQSTRRFSWHGFILQEVRT